MQGGLCFSETNDDMRLGKFKEAVINLFLETNADMRLGKLEEIDSLLLFFGDEL